MYKLKELSFKDIRGFKELQSAQERVLNTISALQHYKQNLFLAKKIHESDRVIGDIIADGKKLNIDFEIELTDAEINSALYEFVDAVIKIQGCIDVPENFNNPSYIEQNKADYIWDHNAHTFRSMKNGRFVAKNKISKTVIGKNYV